MSAFWASRPGDRHDVVRLEHQLVKGAQHPVAPAQRFEGRPPDATEAPKRHRGGAVAALWAAGGGRGIYALAGAKIALSAGQAKRAAS